jgi:hypothetical protein
MVLFRKKQSVQRPRRKKKKAITSFPKAKMVFIPTEYVDIFRQFLPLYIIRRQIILRFVLTSPERPPSDGRYSRIIRHKEEKHPFL